MEQPGQSSLVGVAKLTMYSTCIVLVHVHVANDFIFSSYCMYSMHEVFPLLNIQQLKIIVP